MEQKRLVDLTDHELLQKAKRHRLTSITNAALIGSLIGIVLYSIAKNSLGFFTLIPLFFFVYKLINNSKYTHKELEDLSKDLDLK